MSGGNANYGVVGSYDEDKTPIWVNNGLVGKHSASSWNGARIYDNLRIIVNDAYDGKWLWLSAASAASLNGVYSHSWHQYGASDSLCKQINNVASDVHEYSGTGTNRFGASAGHINGYFTDTNVNRVIALPGSFLA